MPHGTTPLRNRKKERRKGKTMLERIKDRNTKHQNIADEYKEKPRKKKY